ncbi:hypothetical protein HSX37_16305|uniref:Uncharacterized protein n=1 Tax=Dendrosporobacter quercicolus TaxID=146817 RepID=A0A1G9ZTC5_9FIRM|nr:hypothetical protein [Dendrosporobacter quercicolus]NSL49599.1 hypothetical protein [Dendrosporobacter quercicolus DSM 1736]SDN24355.1 hypothetical protein SAMN04488502_11555 [Dendrosporobacter quercicolus]
MIPVPKDKGAGKAACSANSFMLLPGRVVAETFEQAVELIMQRIATKGLVLIKPVEPHPSRVQHLEGSVWWEYYAKVKEREANA